MPLPDFSTDLVVDKQLSMNRFVYLHSRGVVRGSIFEQIMSDVRITRKLPAYYICIYVLSLLLSTCYGCFVNAVQYKEITI